MTLTRNSTRLRGAPHIFAAMTAAVASLALLAGCSTGPVGEESSGQGDDDPAATGQFPRTVTHAYGETTIDSEPQRVATVSWVNADVLLSLGVVPVGMPASDFGGNEQGSTEWFDAALAEQGGEMPETYSETDGINAEAIAALEPDLIVGAYSGMSEEEYDELSGIAPVVPMPEGAPAFGTNWDEATSLVGEAVGREDRAGDVIDEVNGQIEDYAAEHPALDGASFIYGTLDPDAADPIQIFSSIDNRPRFMSSLGMEQAPAVAAEESPDEFYVTWSPERADELAADVIVTWAANEGVEDAIAADPLLSRIPAVAEGNVVVQTDDSEVLSLSAASPLSLPWALENVVPDITATVEQARA